MITIGYLYAVAPSAFVCETFNSVSPINWVQADCQVRSMFCCYKRPPAQLASSEASNWDVDVQMWSLQDGAGAKGCKIFNAQRQKCVCSAASVPVHLCFASFFCRFAALTNYSPSFWRFTRRYARFGPFTAKPECRKTAAFCMMHVHSCYQNTCECSPNHDDLQQFVRFVGNVLNW